MTRLAAFALTTVALLFALPATARPDADRFLGKGVPHNEPGDRRVDTLDLDLSVKIDPSARTVEGTAILSGKVVVPGGWLILHAVDLDIRDAAWLSEPPAGGSAPSSAVSAETPVSIAINEGVIRLRPPVDTAGAPFKLRIRYKATPAQGIYVSGPSKDEPDRPLHMHTQGEPIEARHWIPCPDNPDERMTWTVRATLPERMVVLSNGDRLGDQKNGKWRTTTWRMAHPHPIYLLSLVAGPYVEVVHRKGRVRVSTWAFAPDRARVARSAKRLPEMLDFFAKKTGVPYPFARYGEVFADEFSSGGMENVALTTLTSRALGDDRSDLDRTIEPLLAHELAHQWFGDMVTCRTWADIWLNEGFATYFQKLWTAHALGQDRFAEEMDGSRSSSIGHDNDAYLRAIVSDRYRHPAELFDTNSYPKGAWVLHMLRERIGDQAFFMGITNYLKNKRFGSVQSADLQHELEAVSGQSLRGFFARWVHQAGHPELHTTIRWDGRAKRLRIVFEQRQRHTRQLPLYDLSIEVALRKAGGKVAQLHTVRLTGKRAELTVPAPERPEVVEIDPGMKLFADWHLDAGPDVLAAIALHGRHPDVRLRAVREMRREAINSPRATAKLVTVLGTDRARHVRQAAAIVLGKGHRAQVRPALQKALASDKDAPVRASAAQALGALRDPAAWSGLVAAARDDKSYAVQVRSLQALALIDRNKARPLLLTALTWPSFRDEVKIAALQQLGRIADPADEAVLVAAVAPGQRQHLRSGAAYALAAYAVRTDNRARRDAMREHLEALLHADNRRVHNAAASALGTLGDPASRGPIEAAASRESHYRWAHRLRANLARLGGNHTTNERLRRLEETLEGMQRQGKHERKK